MLTCSRSFFVPKTKRRAIFLIRIRRELRNHIACSKLGVPGTIEITPVGDRDDDDIIFPQGRVNEKDLFAWITIARKLAEECGRLEPCDSRIGQVLAYAPEDPDGTWPCEPVVMCLKISRATSLNEVLRWEFIINGVCTSVSKAAYRNGCSPKNSATMPQECSPSGPEQAQRFVLLQMVTNEMLSGKPKEIRSKNLNSLEQGLALRVASLPLIFEGTV